MSERKAFYRKIAYAVAIAVLLFPLYVLSSPSTARNPQGGKLARLRDEYALSQADLGEIDPASETIKLATLGLRGVAVNLLWNKANEYKKKEDWTSLMAVLEQLSKLQPNFIAFWKFQAWNVSYNVSVEFDDYHDRYYYVKRGIEFLQKGIQYNEVSQQIPELLWDVGWFVGQKIGKADEHVQYRELFRKDDDYHGDRPVEMRDNWLRAEEWYDRAIRAVLEEFKDLGRKSQIVFFQSPASARLNYAEAIEDEGIFGPRAELAWRIAHERFLEFGEQEIEHSTGYILKLNDYEALQAEADQLTAEQESIVPGLKEKMTAERKAELSPAEKLALETPEIERTREQYRLYTDAIDKLDITPQEFAQRIAAEKPAEAQRAMELALEIDQVGTRAHFTKNYRQTANYDYWKTRSEFEQTQDALLARENLYQAQQALDDGNTLEARKLYASGFAHWRRVLDRYPSIIENSVMGSELFDHVKDYRRVLDFFRETLPDEFPLWDIVERYDGGEFSQELAARRAGGGADRPEAKPDVEGDGLPPEPSE